MRVNSINIGFRKRKRRKDSFSWSSYWKSQSESFYIDGLTTPLSNEEIANLGQFLKTLKKGMGISDLSDKFDAIWNIDGETLEVSLRNLVKDDHHLTLAGSTLPIHTSFEGLKGDALNSYVKTDYIVDTDKVNYAAQNASLGFYIRNPTLSDAKYEMGVIDSGKYSVLGSRISVNLFVMLINGLGGTNPTNNSSTPGMFVASRFIDQAIGYKNKISVGTRDYTSTGIPDREMYLLARNNGGTPETFSSQQLSFAFISKGLTSDEVTVLTDAFNTYYSSHKKFSYNSISTGRLDSICYCGNGIVLSGGRSGTAEGHIFRSDNYGDSFTDLGDITGEGIVDIKSDETGNCYVLCESSHLWKSINYGANWSDLGAISSNTPVAPATIVSYALYVTDTGTVLVGDCYGEIFRSIDGGANFTDLGRTELGAFYNFCDSGDGILIYGLLGNIYKSINDGVTWVSKGHLTDSYLFGSCYCGNNIITVNTNDGHIFRSINNGENWTDLGLIGNLGDNMVSSLDGIVLNFTYNTNKHFYRSTDYGATWKDMGVIGSEHTDFVDHAIYVNDGGNNKIIASTNLGYIAIYE